MSVQPRPPASRVWRSSLLASAGGLVPLFLLGLLLIALPSEPEHPWDSTPSFFTAAGSLTLFTAALVIVATLCTAGLAFMLRAFGKLSMRSLVLAAAIACLAPGTAYAVFFPGFELMLAVFSIPSFFALFAPSALCWLFIWRKTFFKNAPAPQACV